jgi:hypothetical protein
MWTGVTKGFAGIKFSGSPKDQGYKKQITPARNIIIRPPSKSFTVK